MAAKAPKKLQELQALFMKEAEKYHVLPIDDRVIVRVNPALAGRPDVMPRPNVTHLYDGMNGMLENTFINVKKPIKNHHSGSRDPSRGRERCDLAQGGRFGGWSLYMKDGKPAYTYNFLGLSQYTVAAKNVVPAGSTKLVLDFKYDGGGGGKGGLATISVDGKVVAEGRIEKTQPLMFSADETADVGLDNQTPVVAGIGIGREELRFTGKIDKITVEVAEVK